MVGLWIRRRFPPNGSEGGMLPVLAYCSCRAAKAESVLSVSRALTYNFFVVNDVGSEEWECSYASADRKAAGAGKSVDGYLACK